MSNKFKHRPYWRHVPRVTLAVAGLSLSLGLATGIASSLLPGQNRAANKANREGCLKEPKGVSQTRFALDGTVVVRMTDGAIRKYSRDGRVLWEAALMATDRAAPPFSPYSFDLDGPDIVAVGVSLPPSRRPEAALYRLEGEVPVAKRVKTLPDWLPGGITVAPDGTLFVVALSARKVNGVLAAAPGVTVTDYSIHQLDREGNLLQSLAAVTYGTDSAFELSEKMAGSKVVFSPSGQAYFHSQNEPVLRRLNLETGELQGYLPLPFAGFAETVNVPALEFVSDSEVVYSLFHSQGSRVLGSQIRTLNLTTGESELLSSTGPDTMMDIGQYDPVGHSIQAVSLRFDQPLGQEVFQLRTLVNRPNRRNGR